MADIKISQLTAKGTAIASTDLIEISESDGAGGYVTKSVTGANIIGSKQDTLVSGTNIKTLNSNSILGSGDLVVQPTLVSGTNIKTIEGQSILGSGNINITNTDVGLGNVDNTSDLNKPISTATQTALNAKQNTITNSDSITEGVTNLFLTTGERTKLTNTSGVNTGDQTNITGNAATVTTNANLTGVVTSTGNTTAIANGAISNAMLANGAVANLSGTNTGDNATNSQYSGLVSNATHTGDAEGNVGLTVKGINGTILSTLGTGILKNTTGTGVPSIAVAADFPILNQNTTGTSGNVTGIVAVANGGTGTATPSLVAGTNVTITGTFPNQTIAASGGGGSMAIGGSITSATAGSVLFAGTSGVLQQDNANLFWDDANNRLGIGTVNPNADLHISKSFPLGQTEFRVQNSSTSGYGSRFTLYSSASGTDERNWAFIQSAWFLGDFSINQSNAQGGNPYSAGTLRLYLSPTGNMGLGGTSTVGSTLQINGNAAIGYNASTAAPTNGLSVSGTVNIGTNTSVTTAALQVSSTTKGFLPPVMTTTQRIAIVTPAAGLIVYDTTDNKHYGYNGTTWNAFY